MGDSTKKNEPNVEVFEPTKEEKAQMRLEKLLSEVDPGFKIAIKRVQPSWCRGHLETIEVYDGGEESSAVDMDYLIRTWGGEQLHLKVHNEKGQWIGGGTVSLFTYPPLRRGKLLREPNRYEFDDQPQQSGFQGHGHFAPTPSMDLTKILDLLSKNKQTDLASIVKLIDYFRGTNPQQQPMQHQIQPQNPMEQMMQMMGLFKEMQGLFGELSNFGQQPADGDSMMPMMTEMIKGLFGAQKQQTPPARAQLSPPQAQNSQKPLVMPNSHPQMQQNTAQPAERSEPRTETTLDDIAAQLAGLSAKDAAEVVTLAMGSMPEDKRGNALAEFMRIQQEVQEDDDQDEFVDDFSQDNAINNRNGDILTDFDPDKYPRR